jgi:uncharacterized protein (TIGR02145 family)
MRTIAKTAITLLITFNAAAFAQEKGTFRDTRDGKTYKITKIGEQTWMAENLNYNAIGSICYDNKEENCKKYGRLYNWETAKKVCATGWHLPSNAEWQTLVNFVGGDEVAGKKLKATEGWNSYEGKSGNGLDAFGFSALPGSDGYSGGYFYGVGISGLWWSSSERNSNYAYFRYMDYYGESVVSYDDDKINLHSVRCVKN